MAEPFLPYGRQWVDDDDIAAVVEVLRSNYLTTGPLVERFESALESISGAKRAIAVNSGTSALHVAYFAAGLSPGDEIITTPLTFVATANAARFLGADVHFVDVCSDTGNLDPALIEDAITERTKLIVPVDYAGHPAEYDEINGIASKHGVTVIADAAHSLGASYMGRPVGSLAHATEVSFHPVKPITTAEGGAVLTDDTGLAQRAASFRTHGIVRVDEELEQTGLGDWWYEMQHLGYNYRITDLQCALGLAQSAKLNRFIERRREIASMYNEALSDLGAIELPGQREHVLPGWHLYVIRVRDERRRRPLFDRLRELGLGVQVHYIPVHWHPYYQRLGYSKGALPVAEAFYSRAISLPIYPGLSHDDLTSGIERIRHAVLEVCGA